MSKSKMIKWIQNLRKDIGQPQHQDLWHYAEMLDEVIDVLDYPSCDECPFGDMTGL